MRPSAPALAALALLAALLAGCADAGPRDGSEPAASATPDAGAPVPVPDEAHDDPVNGTEPTERTVPLRVEGSTAAGACAAGQCHYERTDTAFGVLEPARGIRLVGTLTWDAVSPTSEHLTLYVPTFVDGEYHWEPGYPSASGPSPLAFDLDLGRLGGVPLGLIVGNGVAAATPGGPTAVQTPQPFVLEAQYTYLDG